MAGEVELELQGVALQAALDAPPTTTTLVVRNRAAVVDQYALSVEGLEPAWWEIVPPTVSLFPGEQATATLALHLPPSATAGDYSATVRAVSADNPARFAAAPLSLQVVAAGGLGLSLEPRASAGRLGKHTVTLSNRSNAELRLALGGNDAEEALRYVFIPPNLIVPPFAEATAELEVSPRSAPMWGAKRTHSFSVRAVSEGAEEPAAETEGELEYKPLVGPASLPAARWALLLLLVPLLGLALWLRSLLAEGTAPSPTATPAVAAQVVPSAPVMTAVTVAVPAGGAGGAPLSVSLAASRAEAEAPRALFVAWEVQGGDKAQGEIRNAGSGPLGDPSWQGAYEVEASGSGGSVTAAVQMVSLGPPIIRQYYAKPASVAAGETARFVIELISADEAEIEGQQLDPAAKVWELPNVSPEQAGWYILKARNAIGEVSSITRLDVGPAPAADATQTPQPVPTPAPTPLPLPVSTPTHTATPPPAATSVPATSTPTVAPTATMTATATATPTVPPTPTFTPTATPRPACSVRAFTVTPTTVFGNAWKGNVTLNWTAANMDSIAIRWTDGTGAHTFNSTLDSGSTSQAIYIARPGALTFSLVGYRDSTLRPVPCVGPVETTMWLANTTTFTVDSRCVSGSSPNVTITWAVTAGPGTTVTLIRNRINAPTAKTTLVNASGNLKSSFTDRPPAGTLTSYTLVVRAANGVTQTLTQPPTAFWANCIY